MFTLFGIGFITPWLLVALAALPVLWILLRAVPPAPIRRRFPGVALLLGLEDDETQTDKTPWWLLLLRLLAVAAMIIGFAGPVLNPRDDSAGTGPLLILVDGTWADARDWGARVERIEVLLDEASRHARPVAIVQLTDLPVGELPFQSAASWNNQLAGLTPEPFGPDESAVLEWVDKLPVTAFDTYWLSDGVARESRDMLVAALEDRGGLRVFESPRSVLGLRPARFEDGKVVVSSVRSRFDADAILTVNARGLDPSGIERQLVTAELEFEAGSHEAEVSLSLPPELRNRISRFEIAGIRSAGSVSMTDDALRRREVSLIAGRQDREGLELLSPTHYLEQALRPTADLIEGDLLDVLLANPDVIVLADVAKVSEAEEVPLLEWVAGGGLLLRFAGPRLAASDVSRTEEHPLMPVRLRAGGRNIGGAMSWGEPKALRPFSESSPFFGLSIPDDVRVSSQVMAQPDPNLSERVIASLADGTPLVTRKRLDQGQIVLFHVAANAEWSTLPLSGLFVEMLERLAVSTRPSTPTAEDLAGTTWVADSVLDAYGVVTEAEALPGVTGEMIGEGALSAQMPPGLYSGEDRRIAVNVMGPETNLDPTSWPANIPVEGLGVLRETALKGWLLAAALGILCVDILASLWLSGRLKGASRGVVTGFVMLVASFPQSADAQSEEDLALAATAEVVLAHVLTGNADVDRVAGAGLLGLSDVLWSRTSIEPANPIAINLETDELAFFPFLYWPVTADQPQPSIEAYAKLNRYLRGGGMILFDTRDADIARFGQASPNGRKLQQLARPLDIPALETMPEDHVLTRTFYLLRDFPGRHAGTEIWVEAAPPNAELIEGMPFRNLNDNVTPVVIGGNDWAAAWAITQDGRPLLPVGRGFAGDRQRELANRFGVNLIMHVLTGNYKSDQVHVPALLDRLGQ